MKRVMLVLGLVLSTPAYAKELTVRDVLASLDNHPLVTAVRTRVERAEGEQEAAAGAFDVRLRARAEHAPLGFYDRTIVDGEARALSRVQGVSAYTGWRLGVGKIPDYDFKQATLERGEFRAGIDVPLLRDRSIDRPRADEGRARASRQLAGADVRRRELELAREAVISYWDWVAAGHRLAIRTKQLELAQTRDRGLRRTIDQGSVAPIEGVDNARLIAQREAFVVAARRDLQRAALELSLWFRDERGTPRLPSIDQLPDLGALPPPVPDVEVSLVAARGRQPILEVLAAQVSANEIDLALGENQRLPSVTASAFASRGIGEADPLLPDRSSTTVGVALTFELPVQRRQATGALAIARADRKRLELERRFAMERIEIDVRVAHAEVVAARERVGLTTEQERLALQLADAERQRFDRGDTTILVVNLREEAAADAAAIHVDAVADYRKARARLVVALGEAPRE